MFDKCTVSRNSNPVLCREEMNLLLQSYGENQACSRVTTNPYSHALTSTSKFCFPPSKLSLYSEY